MSPRPRSLASTLALVALLVAAPALAAPGDDAFAAAKKAEAELRFADAVRSYEEALTAAPSAGFALAARARLADLRAQSEGDFAPLARLEAVRRDPAKTSSRDALKELLRDAASFPRGPVQRSARLLAAEAFVRRLGAPADALDPARALLDDPGTEPVVRASAANLEIDALLALGRRDEAVTAAARHKALAPTAWDKLHKEDLRKRVTRIAWGGLAVALIGALALGARAKRLDVGRGLVRSVLTAAVVAAGGAALAHVYDETLSLVPFALLGGGALVADRATSVARGAGASKPVALAIGLVSVVASAWLALTVNGGEYLGGFGL